MPAVILLSKKRGSMAAYALSLLPASADSNNNCNDNNGTNDNNTAVPVMSATRHISGDDPTHPDQGSNSSTYQ